MKKRTHYMILGVSPRESAQGIRAAYRDLARRTHPDAGGQGGRDAFIEVAEAYQVLSDPARRRAYDLELEAAARRSAPRSPITILDEPDSIRPSFDGLVERFVRNFTGLHVPKAERLESLSFDLELTRSEADHGCVVPVAVPTFRECPRCGGAGHDWFFPCVVCAQRGVVEVAQDIEVRIPPGARDGTVLELSLAGLGIHNLYLRFHVIVGT